MMTSAEYQAHLDFMKRRDAIIERDGKLPATHRTVRKAWHGCDIEAGTLLIFSPDLQALFDAHDRNPEPRPDLYGWFIIAGSTAGYICNLWHTELEPLTVHRSLTTSLP